MRTSEKFTDDFKSRYSFADEFLVVCPKCSGKAKVVPAVPWTSKKLFNTMRKLVCNNCCFYQQKLPGPAIAMHVDRDWFFKLPLYYVIETSQGNLYAYNDNHLKYIEEFVSAKVRIRRKSDEYGWPNKSQASRLPKWVKLAKNRLKVLAAIKKLREKG